MSFAEGFNLFKISSVIIPLPAPYSTISSALSKSIFLRMRFTKNFELGIKDPDVLMVLMASLKNFIFFGISVYCLVSLCNFPKSLVEMQFFKDIFYLFFPEVCLACKYQLLKNEYIICTSCRHGFPQTNFTSEFNNLLEKQFYGRVMIKEATALFYFHKKGKIQQLIHELKYKNHQEIGTILGNWLGEDLLKSERFKNLDFIISVPLHAKKRKKRGYNQLTKFGESLSEILQIPFIENKLLKINATDTQTHKGRFERWKNVRDLFELNDISFFENKHILLIDDVVTTGATLEACSNQLLKSKNTTISIAVMAYTK